MRLKVFCAFFLLLALSSCFDDAIINRDMESGNLVPVKLNLSLQTQQPVTRSLFSDFDVETIDDVNILIYTSDGNQLKDSYYYSELDHTTGSGSALALQLNIESGPRKIYVIANWGSAMDELNLSSETLLKSFQLTDRTSNGVPSANLPLLCPVGATTADPYNAGITNIQTNTSINAPLQRLVSRITVKVDDTLLTAGVSVIPTKIALLQVPTTISLGKNTPSSGMAANGESRIITSAELPKILQSSISSSTTPTFSPHNPGNDGIALFMLENMQGQESANADQTIKAPSAAKSGFVTYLEVTAKYTKKEAGVTTLTGTIKYKLYLGEDIYSNFDIKRNTHYMVTLNLKGDGGLSESSWRVVTNIIGGWSADDITHVGYYPGSSGQIRILFYTQEERDYAIANNTISATVTGNLSFTNSGSTITGAVNLSSIVSDPTNPLCAIIPFNISGLANIYYTEREYATVTLTNSRSTIYTPLTIDIMQGAMPKGVGIFRSESSTAIFHADQSNLNLKSYGKWTVRLLSTSTWVKLGGTTVNASGNYVSALTDSNNLLALNKVITGGAEDTEEWVHFDFQPSGTVTNGTVRGGVIEILYNNNLSKHYIYVRQGYAPVQLNTSSGSNVYWGSYNSYGYTGSAFRFMNSPFQVGYMFRPGSSNGLNPYYPGWKGASLYKISNTYRVPTSTGGTYNKWSSFGAASGNTWGTSNNNRYPYPSGYQSATQAQCQNDLVFDFNSTPYRGVFGRVYDDSNNPYWGMLVRQMAGISTPNTSGISVFFATGGSRLGNRRSNNNTSRTQYSGALFYGGTTGMRDNGNPRYGTHYILSDGKYVDIYSNYNNLMGIRVVSGAGGVDLFGPIYWDRGYQVRCVRTTADGSYTTNIQPAGYKTNDTVTGYPLAD